MKLMPKRVKFRKTQRGTIKGKATRCNRVVFGDYGLAALESCWLDAKQIEAGRIAAMHAIGKTAKLYIRVFPHKSITAKPAETRMGTGKGEPEYYAAVIRPGQILYELSSVSEMVAKSIFNLIAHKLPIKVRFVKKRFEV